MRGLGALLAASVVLLAGPACAADLMIDWELRFPFRLFSDYSDARGSEKYFEQDKRDAWLDSWAPRRDLYVAKECMSQPTPILCSERKIGPSRIAALSSALKGEYGQDNNKMAEAFLTAGLRYDEAKRVHFLDKSDPLVVPAGAAADRAPRHKVWLRLMEAGKPLAQNWTCAWKVDDNGPVEGPCSGTKYSIKRTSDPAKTSAISVSIKEHPELRVAPIANGATLVKEAIIVGLGDSYASGEGNPDIPVKMDPKNLKSGWPAREGTSEGSEGKYASYWVDRNCHRSLLSAQTRAAIELAAENPKREIAFIGVACSGAEAYEGILGSYSGTGERSADVEKLLADKSKSPMQKELWRYEMSQLNQVLWALCADASIDANLSADAKYKTDFNNERADGALGARIACPGGLKRPIDAVMLSVGGNDVGFARVILWLLVNGRMNDFVGLSPEGAGCLAAGPDAADCKLGFSLFASQKCQGVDNGKRCKSDARIPLVQKYAKLREALRSLDVEPRRVVLSLYPDPTKSKTGHTCGSETDGYFSAGLERSLLKTSVVKGLNDFGPQFPDEKSTMTATDLRALSSNFIKGSLTRTMLQSVEGLPQKWRIAACHVEEFYQHGLCAVSGKPNAPPEDDPSLSAFRKPQGPGKEIEFNAYADTQRWIRNVNDAYMSQNTHPSLASKGHSLLAKVLFAAKTRFFEAYGAFHPNALGAAAMADAYLNELRVVLADDGASAPSPACGQ